MSKNKKMSAASLKRRKHGLGVPIHIKYRLVLTNIGYSIILVLNMPLYINYIEVPSGIATPFFGCQNDFHSGAEMCPLWDPSSHVRISRTCVHLTCTGIYM